MTTTGEGASNIGEQNASCYNHLRKHLENDLEGGL